MQVIVIHAIETKMTRAELELLFCQRHAFISGAAAATAFAIYYLRRSKSKVRPPLAIRLTS